MRLREYHAIPANSSKRNIMLHLLNVELKISCYICRFFCRKYDIIPATSALENITLYLLILLQEISRCAC